LGSPGVAVMDGKIWGYGAGFARPIPPISSLFQRFPENRPLHKFYNVIILYHLNNLGGMGDVWAAKPPKHPPSSPSNSIGTNVWSEKEYPNGEKFDSPRDIQKST